MVEDAPVQIRLSAEGTEPPPSGDRLSHRPMTGAATAVVLRASSADDSLDPGTA